MRSDNLNWSRHILVVWMVWICFGYQIVLADDGQKKPNILLFLVNNLGPDQVGAYGGRFHETDAMDFLAQDGIVFTRAYAPSPSGVASRASLLTGLHPIETGISDGEHHAHELAGNKYMPPKSLQSLAPEFPTLAVLLNRQSHYSTSWIGSWQLGSGQSSASAHGFEFTFAASPDIRITSYFSPYQSSWIPDGPEGEHLPERIGREARIRLSDLKVHPKSSHNPFFMVVSYYSISPPFHGRTDLVAKYRSKLLRASENKPHDMPLPDPHHAAMVESVDESIGSVLAALDRLNFADNTLVVLASDNGSGCITTSRNDSPDSLNALSEDRIRIPLIMRWPGQMRSSSHSSKPVMLTDLFYTLTQAGGIDENSHNYPKSAFTWRSLYESIPSSERSRILYWHFPHYGNIGAAPVSGVMRGDFKLVRHYGESPLLFDVVADPHESLNRALTREGREIAANLAIILDNRLKDLSAPHPVLNPSPPKSQ